MKKITLIISLLCSILFIGTAMSQTRRYVKVVATGTGNGSSWANASSDLQAMINASAANDEIWIMKGTYRPTSNAGFYNASMQPSTDPRHKSFVIGSGAKLYGGFGGTETVLGQRKYPTYKTILSGDLNGNDAGFTNNSENAYHVIMVSGTFLAPAVIDGITITGGNTTGMPTTYFDFGVGGMQEINAGGAGLCMRNYDFTANNCIFSYNNSTQNGGAIISTGITGNVSNCLFLNNNATLEGGAVYSADNQDTYVNCTFFGNSSAGAIVHGQNQFYYITLQNSIIWGNTGSAISGSIIAPKTITQGDNSGLNVDPLFSNPSDPDGPDNILGDTDDGLIPQCGPAIGGGSNQYGPITGPAGQSTFTVAPKDLKGGARIMNGTVDLGAYETSLIQPITSFTIQMAGNAITSESAAVSGFCNGRLATFWITQNNGGTFEWKRNATVVGTNSNVFTTATMTNGDVISVKLTSPAGCGPANVVEANTGPLDVAAAKPKIPVKLFGAINACPYINGPATTYYINKVANSQYYHWSTNGNPGMTLTHINPVGVNDTIVQIAYNSNFTSGSILVSAESNCGIGPDRVLAISKAAPLTAGVITGILDPCPYMQSADNPSGTAVSYKIIKVANASSYIWTAPANATISSHPAGLGFNDTIVTVIYNSSFVSGTLTVQAANFCGAGPVRSLSISRKIANTPSNIAGPIDACPYKQTPQNPSGTPVNYSTRKALYATFYTWTLPAGAAATHPGGPGINDTIITVTYNSSFTGGAITVKANTNCNSSAARSLAITAVIPSTPVVITASAATACPQRRVTYSLASMPSHAVSVQWTVPASGILISGQGTLSIVVEFAGPTTSADSIRAVGVNGCGTGAAPRKFKVGVLPACRPAGSSSEQNIPSAITKTEKIPAVNINAEFEIKAMPNPSQQRFTLQLTGADNNTPVMIQIMDIAGRFIESKQNIQNNQTIIIGDTYKPGIYFATFLQGTQKKILRLVKL